MRLKLLVLVTCYLSLAPNITIANPSIDKIKEMVYIPTQLSGSFEQEKSVGEVDVTLKSSGTFAIDKEKGIKWQIQKPYSNTTIIQDGKLCMKNDADSQTIDSENNQVLKHIIGIMQNLLVQDYDSLSEYFDITHYKTKKFLKIILTTKDQTMSKVFSNIEIIITKYVDEVYLYSPESDLTVIKFSKVTEKAKEFSCD